MNRKVKLIESTVEEKRGRRRRRMRRMRRRNRKKRTGEMKIPYCALDSYR